MYGPQWHSVGGGLPADLIGVGKGLYVPQYFQVIKKPPASIWA